MDDGKEKLPGEEMVDEGLRDLAEKNFSSTALLVLIGAPRLSRMGLVIPQQEAISDPEHSLYESLQKQNPKNAHSCYNALIRRLVSYERALERSRRAAKV